MRNWLFPLWVIIDVLVFLTAMALWIAAPEYKTLNIGLTVFATALGFLLMFAKFEEIKTYVRSSYFEKVLFHGINVLLVVSILGVANYLGNKNYKEFDLTKEKRNSLTDQTVKVLDMVKSPLKMTVFARREEWNGILNLLKLYVAQNKNIKLEAIDTDLRPDLVKAKEITQNGTVVLDYQGKESQFPVIDELSVTNALLKVLRTEKIVLYFVTGHQELSCEEKSPEGISVLCEKLRLQNYELRPLELTKVDRVPKDATAVFVLGPISGFLPQEANLIKEYLNTGGSFFLALAPAFKSELYDNLTKLMEPYGLELGKDVVIDRLSTVQGAEATIPIISNYDNQHPITEGFNLRTVFPLSSSVRTIKGKDSAQLLATTSNFPGSWAETNLKGVTEGKAEYNEKSDLKGPIGLLGISELAIPNTPRDSRVVLLGSSSFLVNAYQAQAGNTTLFLNTVSWMVDDEGIISFNRPGLEEPPVILSAQHLQMIFVISILVVPIIFFGTAIFVYRRRRLL
ncbi:GldG family protein [Peredibacter starrii]|uniref:GldG family protein n=1 Tax=Peredibacter starrii TaxID=28202 RepID=A0AAX4HSH2_9BACT|nr:GldG family protein [Peredibacter starrii]WPU66239.1 GldG family protein [Peredibacter starrii]